MTVVGQRRHASPPPAPGRARRPASPRPQVRRRQGHGTGTSSADKSAGCQPFNGTGTLTGLAGAKINFKITGAQACGDSETGPFSISGRATVTGGAGAYKKAKGSLKVTGIYNGSDEEDLLGQVRREADGLAVMYPRSSIRGGIDETKVRRSRSRSRCGRGRDGDRSCGRPGRDAVSLADDREPVRHDEHGDGPRERRSAAALSPTSSRRGSTVVFKVFAADAKSKNVLTADDVKYAYVKIPGQPNVKLTYVAPTTRNGTNFTGTWTVPADYPTGLVQLRHPLPVDRTRSTATSSRSPLRPRS